MSSILSILSGGKIAIQTGPDCSSYKEKNCNTTLAARARLARLYFSNTLILFQESSSFGPSKAVS